VACRVKTVAQSLEVSNADETILVLVHGLQRTLAGDLHAKLLARLSNSARIGFTGKPIQTRCCCSDAPRCTSAAIR
jgi:type I restriction enzyme R subunit